MISKNATLLGRIVAAASTVSVVAFALCQRGQVPVTVSGSLNVSLRKFYIVKEVQSKALLLIVLF